MGSIGWPSLQTWFWYFSPYFSLRTRAKMVVGEVSVTHRNANGKAAMSEEVLEIVQAAVNLARFDGIRRLDALKSRLLQQYPGKTAEIDEAIQTWASYAARTR